MKRRGIAFREIDLTEDQAKRDEAERQFGWMTVPMIVIGDKFIGGADELHELDRKGGLAKLVA